MSYAYVGVYGEVRYVTGVYPHSDRCGGGADHCGRVLCWEIRSQENLAPAGFHRGKASASMINRFWDVVMYTILAAMLVLVVMNAKAVSDLVAAGGKIWIQETTLLTGSGYKKAS